MRYTYILVRVFAPIINLLVMLINVVVKRNKRIVLFGAWMGDKYTDNSRYLFEYLNLNKKKYNLEKVIWVTRNKNVYSLLSKRGVDVYMMHSLKSFYYHLKAGVHIICNMEFPKKNYAGDIMGQFSGNAIKINIWHGIPIKAGRSTGENNMNKGIAARVRFKLRNSKLFCSIFTPGHWDKEYMFSTGKECTRRLSEFCGIDKENFIECGYPRNCRIIDLQDKEKEIISKFGNFNSVILYLPTFRDSGDIPHPLNDKALCAFIKDNNYLWIEKPHPTMKNNITVSEMGDNILFLQPDFDINVIMPEITMLISDYSSAIYDAASFDKAILYYAPDYEYYLKHDRGFLCDYIKLSKNLRADNPAELISLLTSYRDSAETKENVVKNIKEIRREILEVDSVSYDNMLNEIAEKIHVFGRWCFEDEK